MVALVLLVALSADPVCFWPHDDSPGWKQVSLPPDAVKLAAPDGVDQFRSEDVVEVVDDHPGAFLAGNHWSQGQTSFEVPVSPGACRVELQFQGALRGAKVDVTAWGPHGTVSIEHERRVPGPYLELSYGDLGVRTLTVVVHDHLRDAPVLASFRSVCRLNAVLLPVSDAYRVGRSLYYLQPPGPRVPLCHRPTATPRIDSRRVPSSGFPAATAVNRG